MNELLDQFARIDFAAFGAMATAAIVWLSYRRQRSEKAPVIEPSWWVAAATPDIVHLQLTVRNRDDYAFQAALLELLQPTVRVELLGDPPSNLSKDRRSLVPQPNSIDPGKSAIWHVGISVPIQPAERVGIVVGISLKSASRAVRNRPYKVKATYTRRDWTRQEIDEDTRSHFA